MKGSGRERTELGRREGGEERREEGKRAEYDLKKKGKQNENTKSEQKMEKKREWLRRGGGKRENGE